MDFPLVNQLAGSDVNDADDCVPASFAAGASYALGRMLSYVTLKDEAKGTSYRGFQSPNDYVQVAASYGIDLVHVWFSSPEALVAHLHSCMRANVPVLATIPSQWGTPVAQQPAGFTTHCICFAPPEQSGDLLRAMNPWQGQWMTDGDAYWTARLVGNDGWEIRVRTGATPVADNTAGLGTGILAYVQAHGISGQSLIAGGEADLYPGNHTGERIAAFAPNDVVYWDGSAVKEHVDAYVVAGLHAAQATLVEQLAAAQQQNAQLQQQVQNLVAQVNQLKAQPPAPAPAPAQPSDAVTAAITNLVDVIASEILKGKVA